MEELSVQHKGKNYSCFRYSVSDEPAILDVFFFWKTSVLLAEQTKSKKPQLPETFSEPFCCLACGLVHKIGAGLDAFRVDSDGHAQSSVEIKATITKGGFTDVKRELAFDELIWLSFSGYASLSYNIYRILKADLVAYVEKSNTQRDRATVNLKNIVSDRKLKPLLSGRIGIIAKVQEDEENPSTSLTEQVSLLPNSD